MSSVGRALGAFQHRVRGHTLMGPTDDEIRTSRSHGPNKAVAIGKLPLPQLARCSTPFFYGADRDGQERTPRMSDPIKTAQQILADAGQGRVPRDVDALVDLARDYLSWTGSETLGQTGRLYVSLTAAREYGTHERIHNDWQAAREVHELLLDAKQSASDPTAWRTRKRSTGLDVTARVVEDGRLLVVTTVSVRDANVGGRHG